MGKRAFGHPHFQCVGQGRIGKCGLYTSIRSPYKLIRKQLQEISFNDKLLTTIFICHDQGGKPLRKWGSGLHVRPVCGRSILGTKMVDTQRLPLHPNQLVVSFGGLNFRSHSGAPTGSQPGSCLQITVPINQNWSFIIQLFCHVFFYLTPFFILVLLPITI
jgi:hypothetical protein